MLRVLKASVSSLVSFSLLYYPPIHTMSRSASHFHHLQAPVWWHQVLRHHRSAFSETAYVPWLPWLKGWKCQHLRGWDLGSLLFITGQYVILICLANEELTFPSACFFAEMTTAEELTVKAELWRWCWPFGISQSKGSQAQMSTSQLWLPQYWAWRNSTKTGQYWSNLPLVH